MTQPPAKMPPTAPDDTPNHRAMGFFRNLPHANALGMVIERMADGQAAMHMPWRDDLVGDPETGVIHGGAVSALMDTCCGAAAMSHPDARGGTATLGLRIDYMRAATPGQTIRAEATCHHITRSVAFVRAVALDDDATRPVATATGTFTVEGG